MEEENAPTEETASPFDLWELSVANTAFKGFNNGFLNENGYYKLEFLHEGVNFCVEVKAKPTNIIQFPTQQKKTK